MYVNQNLTELRIASQELSSSLQQVRNNMEQTLNSNDCKNQPSCESILSSLSDLDTNNNLAQVREATLFPNRVSGTAGWESKGDPLWNTASASSTVITLERWWEQGRRNNGKLFLENSRLLT